MCYNIFMPKGIYKHKPHSKETRQKIKNSRWIGSKNTSWKGNNAGYSAMHLWVSQWKGRPKKCEMCGTTNATKYEWANKDHTYKRILDDYIRMCVRCHRNYDKNRGVKVY